MKTLLLAVILLALGVFNAMADITLNMTAEPAHPIIGDVVVWKVQADGGEPGEPYTFDWNSSYLEFPSLYEWSAPYPFMYATSVTNVYNIPGDKTVTATAHKGTDWVERSLTIHVTEAEINVTAPAANDIWYVGNTYEITWSTRGHADTVQIGLFDFRYNTETGNAGETIIEFQVPNTGSYKYTVPPPSPDGISAGNLGGRNYQIFVGSFNDCVNGFSKKFTISTRTKKHK